MDNNDRVCSSEHCPFKGRVVVQSLVSIYEAKIVVVGEAPGSEEERLGRPFVGRSGSLLHLELEALGVDPLTVCFMNVVRCRPYNNEDPPRAVIEECRKVHEAEWLELYNNKVVLCVGLVAAKVVVSARSLGAHRGKIKIIGTSKILVVWHPAYILRNMKAIHQWRRDLQQLPGLVGEGRSAIGEIPKIIVKTDAEFDAMEQELLVSTVFSYDLETVGVDPFEEGVGILCIGFATKDKVWIVPTDDSFAFSPYGYVVLERVFKSSVDKIAINAKFDNLWLRVHGEIIVEHLFFDPQLAQHLLDEGVGTSVSLKQLVWRYFPNEGGYEKDIDYANMAGMAKDRLYEYCAKDCILTLMLVAKIFPQLEQKNMSFLYFDVCHPTIESLVEMEYNGLFLDEDRLLATRQELNDQTDAAAKALLQDRMISSDRKASFNIRSLKQIEEVLINGYGLPVLSTTAKGSPQFNVDTLSIYADQGNTFARNLLLHRKTSKIVSTYLDNFVEGNYRGGVHGRYGLITTVGGRLSSSHPNMQNFPKFVRVVFKSRFLRGKLVQLDFSQMEMRVLGYVTGDEGLATAFNSGVDVHKWVMAEVKKIIDSSRDWKPEDITDAERSQAKATNFGLIYGRSAVSIAREFGMSDEDGIAFVDSYFQTFPKVAQFQTQIRRRISRGVKLATSLFGRKRKLDMYDTEVACRKAFNFPIQSLASDLNLMVLNIIREYLKEHNMESKLVATVHDSIVVDCPENEIAEVVQLMHLAPDTLDLAFITFSLKVDISVGSNWGEMVLVRVDDY